jgi:hypothetical protein
LIAIAAAAYDRDQKRRREINSTLTAGFFEIGAMPVPTKSQNPTVWG